VATCHLLSGATWPASCHRNHHQTIGQWWSTATIDGGQRRSTVADHRSTTAGPPINHRRTTGQRRLTASQQSGQMVATAATWHATSANWVPVAYVAATSAVDVAEGIITFPHRFKLGTS
ncbi:hypothetical protein Tco_0391986, partial [Tanacetum coccineum]